MNEEKIEIIKGVEVSIKPSLEFLHSVRRREFNFCNEGACF